MTAVATELVIDVAGEPCPQGSMIPVTRNGRTVLVPDNSAGLKRWRRAIVKAAKARVARTGWLWMDGPVEVDLTFWLTRPETAKNRARPYVRPDLDKLVRAVFDSLTEAGCVWSDDSRAVTVTAGKYYAQQTTGVRITVRPIEAVLL